MVSAVVQTVLVVASPWLLPRVVSLLKAILMPSPGGTRTPLASSSQPTLPLPLPLLSRVVRPAGVGVYVRLVVLALGLSLALSLLVLSPPPNVFLDLAPAHSLPAALVPLLRTPLDLRLPTDTLHRLWTLHNRRPLTAIEENVLNKMKTLDARVVYALTGAASLQACEWCASPSAHAGPRDHVLFVLPGIAFLYVSMLVAVGVLTAGARLRWRTWAASGLTAAALVEVYVRLSYVGVRATGITMLHSQLHAARFTFFSLVLILAFFAPATPTLDPRLSTSTSYLAPTLAALTHQTELLINRLRAVSLQRMALLHDGDSRAKINQYWTEAEQESIIARADPAVCELRTRAAANEDEDRAFREWVDGALGVGLTSFAGSDRPSSAGADEG